MHCLSVYFQSLLYCFHSTFLQRVDLEFEVLLRLYKFMSLLRENMKHLQEVTIVFQNLSLMNAKAKVNVWRCNEGKTLKVIKNIICTSTMPLVAASELHRSVTWEPTCCYRGQRCPWKPEIAGTRTGNIMSSGICLLRLIWKFQH